MARALVVAALLLSSPRPVLAESLDYIQEGIKQLKSRIEARRTAECFKIDSLPKDYIQSHAEAPDFALLLAGADFLLVSDVHDEGFIKETLVRYMPELRRAGLIYLALEMLPADARVDELNEAALRRVLHDSFIKTRSWPVEPYVRLIQAATRQGIKVRGVNFTTRRDEEADLLKREGIRNLYNIGDAYMARKALMVSREVSGGKVLVFAGSAHMNPFYDDDNPVRKVPNTRILGELWHLGIPRNRVRSVEIRKLGGFNPFRQPFYLPLPTGALPGCAPIEAHSALDGVLYSPD